MTESRILKKPTAEMIRAARVAAGLTQAEAAAVVHRPSYRTWQDWERGRARMPLDAWELFLLKTGQHPTAQYKILSIQQN